MKKTIVILLLLALTAAAVFGKGASASPSQNKADSLVIAITKMFVSRRHGCRRFHFSHKFHKKWHITGLFTLRPQ
ncbi:MAG: hypothetical protein LBD55_06675 [Treponema sp.]|jgi:hypothetical protein|nr:hypothetical protein [Treponema sp.]